MGLLFNHSKEIDAFSLVVSVSLVWSGLSTLPPGRQCPSRRKHQLSLVRFAFQLIPASSCNKYKLMGKGTLKDGKKVVAVGLLPAVDTHTERTVWQLPC